MDSKKDMFDGLRRAMQFYSELGFEYLPLRTERIMDVLTSLGESGRGRGSKEGVPAADVHDRGSALQKLRQEIGDCQRCKLSRGRKNIVFGEGAPDAALMFIGEGPGRDEDIQGMPFVGEAGKLLTKLILKLGLKREDVYIANIVKCRPPYNRNPDKDEISTCRPFVERQIGIIRPEVIVCLGKISAQSLLNREIPISRMRGNFLEFQGIPVMPTFHPAYLLRNPKDKWLTWDDMQKVMEKINAG